MVSLQSDPSSIFNNTPPLSFDRKQICFDLILWSMQFVNEHAAAVAHRLDRPPSRLPNLNIAILLQHYLKLSPLICSLHLIASIRHLIHCWLRWIHLFSICLAAFFDESTLFSISWSLRLVVVSGSMYQMFLSLFSFSSSWSSLLPVNLHKLRFRPHLQFFSLLSTDRIITYPYWAAISDLWLHPLWSNWSLTAYLHPTFSDHILTSILSLHWDVASRIVVAIWALTSLQSFLLIATSSGCG